MDVKEAIRIAKAHIADLFAEERPMNIGLEEVEYDEGPDIWRITIGLSRPWDRTRTFLGDGGLSENPAFRRAYKVVSVDKAGRVLSVKDRKWAEA